MANNSGKTLKETDRELAAKTVAMLKEAGFCEVETRWSSTSLTVSGCRGNYTAILHIATPQLPEAHQALEQLPADACAVKATVPSLEQQSGAGLVPQPGEQHPEPPK
ncbi:hypothetical protein [Streptomyces sp. CA-106110]|uniref:hypothetical protein n=1 Tax=Streptomyces sp. CA-106110 TaxID=3240044 RepID=UPI003D91FCE4